MSILALRIRFFWYICLIRNFFFTLGSCLLSIKKQYMYFYSAVAELKKDARA